MQAGRGVRVPRDHAGRTVGVPPRLALSWRLSVVDRRHGVDQAAVRRGIRRIEAEDARASMGLQAGSEAVPVRAGVEPAILLSGEEGSVDPGLRSRRYPNARRGDTD